MQVFALSGRESGPSYLPATGAALTAQTGRIVLNRPTYGALVGGVPTAFDTSGRNGEVTPTGQWPPPQWATACQSPAPWPCWVWAWRRWAGRGAGTLLQKWCFDRRFGRRFNPLTHGTWAWHIGVAHWRGRCPPSIVIVSPAGDHVKVCVIYRVHQPVGVINAP